MSADHLIGNLLNMVMVGRKRSLSMVGLQRWILWYTRVNFLLDIELHTQARRKLLVARQYYIEFSVGDVSRSTNRAKEAKNRTSWDNVFYLWYSPIVLCSEIEYCQ